MELNIESIIETSKSGKEAENRVRRFLSSIPEEDVSDFIVVMEKNLKSFGSNLSVGDIIKEMKK